ncbi:hypothetical protein ACHWQZ_G019499 [Mnemiopsis leidyi]
MTRNHRNTQGLWENNRVGCESCETLELEDIPEYVVGVGVVNELSNKQLKYSKAITIKGNTDIRPRERAIWRSLLKTLSRYGLEKTAENSARITVFGRVLPRYLRLATGRGFSWEELEEVDLRYRARASSKKYDRGHRVRGYDRATTIARLRMKIVELQTQLAELV